ncbi:MAG TPA: DUF1800 domain-containing protein [Oceanospirillales bacterium]|nr:DUF1800 domain-containing protein [Oceanospirillales bacterium]
MANTNYYSRRNFLSQLIADNSKRRDYKRSFLNPLGSINHKLLKELPPLDQDVLFLNRSSFGIRPSDFQRIKSIGIENYLEQQLDYESIDNSALDEILDLVFPLVNLSLFELIAYIEEGQLIGEDRSADAAVQLISATMMRQMYSKHQLFEVMVEFWSNHFNIDISKGLDLILKVHEDKNIIRPHAIGNFREILHADSKSSTMMFYLDNHTNTKFGPNENYARELMELHTLGVDGGFSENDVKEVARCFTGWSIGDANSDLFTFYPENHDDGIKNVLGHVIDNDSGIADGEQVVDILADSSVTAGFIAKKMIRRFCSDNPDIQLLRSVAKTYLSTDGDMKAMLRNIFHSRQFLSSVDAKFKRPIEFVSSLFRSVDSESGQTSLAQRFAPLSIVINEYEASGQIPFFWSPPTGYPDVAAYWTNVSAILRRINLSTGVALGDLDFTEGEEQGLYSEFINYDYSLLMADANTAEEIISVIENSILYRDMTQADRDLLIDFLLQEGAAQIPEQRIRAVIGMVLSSTYFQLR